MNNEGKILICSAEESIRESLKLVLGDSYNLILCENIDQCSDILKNANDVNTLLLDVHNQNDVLSAVESIKSNNSSIKIIVACRHTQANLAQEAVGKGADGYIVTPFKSDELLSICK